MPFPRGEFEVGGVQEAVRGSRGGLLAHPRQPSVLSNDLLAQLCEAAALPVPFVVAMQEKGYSFEYE